MQGCSLWMIAVGEYDEAARRGRLHPPPLGETPSNLPAQSCGSPPSSIEAARTKSQTSSNLLTSTLPLLP